MISLLEGAGRAVLEAPQQFKAMQRQAKRRQETPPSRWPTPAVPPSQNTMGQLVSCLTKLPFISPPAK